MANIDQALKCGASGLSLALALMVAAPAAAQTAPPAPLPTGQQPSASEVRPATAGDRGPEEASDAVQATQAANPGAAAETDAETQEIIVTGTSIRGVAPVGSNLISVGRDTIEETGVQTVQQLLKTVPAVVGLGSTGQGAFGSADGAGTNAPTIHGLGASASNSTLIIIDSHRFPLSGINHALGDPNIIPPHAIERVEVLPDGASSVYGSDAVAGVINFITRRRFEGIEVSAQAGFGDKYKTQQAGIIGGKVWDTGWMFGAYNYSHRGALRIRDRGYLDANNLDEAGAAGIDLSTTAAQDRANLSTFFCDPASVTIGSGATASVYRFDPATNTYGSPVANVARNAFCDVTQGNDAVPDEKRHSFLLKGSQKVGDRLTLGVDFVYSNRKNFQRLSRGANNQTVTATIYGPGSTPPAGASINPFFVPIPGSTATSYSVRFSGENLLGPGAYNLAGEEAWYVYGHGEYELSDTWQVSAGVVQGTTDSSSRDVGRLCVSCASLAINGTAAAVPGYPAANNSPLTTANALDVFRLGSANLTSAAVRARLTDSTVTQTARQGFQQYRAQINGDVLQLPGGTLKLAAGAEYLDYTLAQDVVRPTGLGPASQYSRSLHLDYDRDVKSAFVELFVPVVNPDMNVPGVRSFDVNLAGRYDKYSDFGSTKNPKIGATWEVFQGFKVRGNWAKSFVAPALTSRGADAFGTTGETNIAAGPTNIAVPISTFPGVTSLPGVSCTATTCTIPSTATYGLQINGGDARLQPQKGRTWSLGVDFIPQFFRGFRASATFWHNEIKGGITAPQAAFSVLGAPERLLIFPTGATAAQLATIIGNRPVNVALPSTVYYVYDFRQGNVLNLTAEGIDADARYQRKTGWGGFDVGVAVSRKTRFDQSFGTGPKFSVLNSTGFNTTFPSIKLDVRADLGVDVGPVRAVLYANHTGSYLNWSNNTINPITRSSEGLPIGGGDRVRAHTTFDAHLDVKLPAMAYLPKGAVYADVNNIFDKEPPFYNSANGGFDTFSGNPLGRVITIGFRSRW